MRRENVARVLRFGAEPGAVVDERPAERRRVWPLVVAVFVAGLSLGAIATLLWARAEFAEIRKEMRERPSLENVR